ncbi:MAG: tryptophan synthase subunit alpha [Verrucomicrobiae bacterium]|nr:tryptophan synthase subunit alpha [Verrucomicrobiae bacterium]
MPPPSRHRLEDVFVRLRREGRKAFVAYITAGDPNLRATERLAFELERAGVDVLELGVPFSDPLADGVVNQLAAERALRAGATLRGLLRAVSALRRRGLRLPIVFFTYFNPIHRYGVARFVRDAAAAGADGALVLDLPVEESAVWRKLMERAGLCAISLIAPTTPAARARQIARAARGFIYYVSREGVTGERPRLAAGLGRRVALLRRAAGRTPIVIGFGISTPAQVRAAAALADGCVVGSAIVRRIAEIGDRPSLAPSVGRLVRKLTTPLKSAA